MVTQTPRVGLDDYAAGDDNWDHSDTVNHVDKVTPTGLLDTGTFTATGGSSTTHTVSGVSSTQTIAIRGVVGVDADPSFSADYAFSESISKAWDDTNQHWDVTITVTWDTDPGAGNDVTMNYRLYSE